MRYCPIRFLQNCKIGVKGNSAVSNAFQSTSTRTSYGFTTTLDSHTLTYNYICFWWQCTKGKSVSKWNLHHYFPKRAAFYFSEEAQSPISPNDPFLHHQIPSTTNFSLVSSPFKPPCSELEIGYYNQQLAQNQLKLMQVYLVFHSSMSNPFTTFLQHLTPKPKGLWIFKHSIIGFKIISHSEPSDHMQQLC